MLLWVNSVRPLGQPVGPLPITAEFKANVILQITFAVQMALVYYVMSLLMYHIYMYMTGPNGLRFAASHLNT